MGDESVLWSELVVVPQIQHHLSEMRKEYLAFFRKMQRYYQPENSCKPEERLLHNMPSGGWSMWLLMWLSCDWSCDCHVTGHVTDMWLVMWLTCDCHVTDMRLSCDWHATYVIGFLFPYKAFRRLTQKAQLLGYITEVNTCKQYIRH